jgi:hypothetical protein
VHADSWNRCHESQREKAYSITKLAFTPRYAYIMQCGANAMKKTWQLKAVTAIGVICAVIAGCADTPPVAPPRPLTKEEADRLSDQRIETAIYYAALAGQDPSTVRIRLYFNRCLAEAQHLTDTAQRSAALAQCRIDYPQPAVAQSVRTNCYSSSGVTHCTSQ